MKSPAQKSLETSRSEFIETAVDLALSKKRRHWDLVYHGIEGIRSESEAPTRSWERLPRLSLTLGERMFSKSSILEHDDASWFAMQIVSDLIWISGFALVGSDVENDPSKVAPYLLRSLRKSETDVDRFDPNLLESHNRWCYYANMVDLHNDPSPFYLAAAAESTLNIAALVIDLGLETELLPEKHEVEPNT